MHAKLSVMPYTSPYVYFRVNGKFSSASPARETFSVGFKLPMATGAPTSAALLAFLTAMATPVTTFHTGQINSGSETYLTDLTAAFVGTDGKYVGGGTQVTTRYTYPTPVPGLGTPRHAWSSACVISLRTLIQRGRASNGRAYWPATAIVIDQASGQFNTANTDGIAAAAKVLCDAINTQGTTHFPTTLGLAVMSNLGVGTTSKVVAVRVGTRPDSQERREKSIKDVYSTVNLAGATQLLEERDGREIGSSLH